MYVPACGVAQQQVLTRLSSAGDIQLDARQTASQADSALGLQNDSSNTKAACLTRLFPQLFRLSQVLHARTAVAMISPAKANCKQCR